MLLVQIPAYSGAIGVIYAEVDQVPFNQDSSGNVNRNTIRFRAANTLGTLTTQANAAAIDINTSSPTSLTVVSPNGLGFLPTAKCHYIIFGISQRCEYFSSLFCLFNHRQFDSY